MAELRLHEAIEIIVDRCSRTFGVSPCIATGEECYQTRNITNDCKDPENYNATTHTYIFGKPTGFFPHEIGALQNIRDISFTNSRAMPAKSVGAQAQLSVTFDDHPTNDVRLDPYYDQRAYIASDQGTFWGKFFAINPYIHQAKIKYKRWYGDQDYSEAETYNLYISDFSRDESGRVTIQAVDFTRLLYEKNALCPEPSPGFLLSDITDGATSLTLTPAGIGDSYYAASGEIAVGEEAMTFTRSGDVMTITRAARDTEAKEHKAGEVVQVPKIWTSTKSSQIIHDLVTEFSELDSSFTNVDDWNALLDEYPSELFTAYIPKPTETVKLINEICVDAGVILTPNIQTEKLLFQPVTQLAATQNTFHKNRMIEDSFASKTENRDRVSQVIVSYGVKSAFKNLKDPGNYYSHELRFLPENLYPKKAYKVFYSRWIPTGASSVAASVGDRYLAWKQHGTYKFSFMVKPRENISVGELIFINHWTITDCAGAQRNVPAIVVEKTPHPGGYYIECDEYRFDPLASGNKVITLSANARNINLRDIYDQLYTAVDEVNEIRFVVREGVVIGSESTSLYSLVRGSWPVGVEPVLLNYGHIVGRGADGVQNGNGLNGGDAIYTDGPLEVDNQGVIGSGGGSGGGHYFTGTPPAEVSYAGGGGAGDRPGNGGSYAVYGVPSGGGGGPGGYAGLEDGQDGITFSDATYTGAGGDLGQSGSSSSSGKTGGSPGVAVDGDSHITWTTVGDIRGSRIN